MTEKEQIEHLTAELDRAYRALCGYATAAGNGVTLADATVAYHSLTVAAAKRWVIEGAMDGAGYFTGKPVAVLHAALNLTGK